jgi:hypothetical protein
MLPNNNPSIKFRLKQLCNAVKLIYSSVFYKSPKEFVRNTNFRIEEEKMAVIIQQVVGNEHNGTVYPIVSGIAQSYNYYPISYMKPDEGVAELALGLGIIIAEGGRTYRFSPKYPEMNPPFSSAAEFVRKSQSDFFALNLSDPELSISVDEKFSLNKLDLKKAEDDGTLFFVASTFVGADNVIRDTIHTDGPRVLTFANLLKYNLFPLSHVLNEILSIGRESFGSHIEIEFAVNLFKDKGKKPEFFLLQIRPMVVGKEHVETSLEGIDPNSIICMSEHSMGNGVFKEIFDIVYVNPETFNPSKTRVIASEIGKLNQMFIKDKRRYLLMGFGRWGTKDPWLGIPVEWHQISNAQMIVESNLDDFIVEPSLGSHFFHNLTSLGLGYFHIPRSTDKTFIRWDWLKRQKVIYQTKHVNHVRFLNPIEVRINARLSTGVIFKPDLV